MIPTITDLSTANDNQGLSNKLSDDGKRIVSTYEKMSGESKELSIVYKRLANDQANIDRSYRKTVSRIIARHNDHDRRPDLAMNNNSLESYVRPKASVSQSLYDKTLDRIIARHNAPNEEGVHLYSWENDNQKDFYTLANRDPTEEDHEETLSRIMSRQTANEDVEPVTHTMNESDHKFARASDGVDALKSIENNTTNILDVLKQIHGSLGDISSELDVAHQRAKEMDKESSHGSGHMDMDSLSEAISRAIKDNSDKDQEDKKSLLSDAGKIASGLEKISVAARIGAFAAPAAFVASYLPQKKKEETGGFSGREQNYTRRATFSGRRGGKTPEIQGAPDMEDVTPVKIHQNQTQKRNEIMLAKNLHAAGFDNKDISNIFGNMQGESAFISQSERIEPNDPGVRKIKGGWNYRGRGFIQLTGIDNYRRMDNELHMGGELIRNPDLANRTDIAARIASQYFLDEKRDHHYDFHKMSDAVRAEAPKHWRSKVRERERYARAFSDARINEDINARGAALNQQSFQQGSKSPVIVVNNNNQTINASGSGGQQSRPKIPPARSHFWDGWASYFGL